MSLLSEGISDNVVAEGCDVSFATSEESAYEVAQRDRPSLAILMVGSPHIDTLRLFKKLRSDPATASLPILIMSAEDSEAQEVLFLDSGADDYIGGTAALNAESLFARCRAILRRSTPPSRRPRKASPSSFSIDSEANEVTIGKRVYKLAPKQLKLFQYLARNQEPVTRQTIFRKVWAHRRRELPPKGNKSDPADFITQSRRVAAAKSLKTVEVHLASLRKKLGKRLIKNIRNKGYLLDLPPRS